MDEQGSDAMRRFAAAEFDESKVVSALARVEASSAICRLTKGGRLNQTEAAEILREIVDEVRRLNEQPITKKILDTAIALMDRREIRTLDAIQLGSAMALRDRLVDAEVRFIGADQRLLRAAEEEGFNTWDPTAR